MQEFKAFKQSPEYERMFASGANPDVKHLRKDLEIFKSLSLSQRIIRFAFMFYDIIIVTPQTMPKFYGFVDNLCKKNGIETPTIFIALDQGFFNAAASKLFKSSGAIIIGKQLLKQTSDNALEAILAHEIGHIKHNHVNKMLLLLAACAVSGHVVSSFLDEHWQVKNMSELSTKKTVITLIDYAFIFLGPALIINKQFEKEADMFACENGHAHGVVEAFELFLDHSQKNDADLVEISDKVNADRKNVGIHDYLQLKLRLGMVKLCHKFSNAYKWIYYNTPWGAHPSPEARIDAAQNYLATH